MRRARKACAAIVIGLAVIGLVTPASADVVVTEVGWWSSSPTASAPAGGLAVGATATGTTAVGAIRIAVGRGVTSATLTLVESGGRAQDAAAIQACQAADDWQPASGGAMGEAPEFTCVDPPIGFVRTEGRWTADVTPLLGSREGAVSVMIVPADDLDLTATLGLGFEVEFGPPLLQATEEPPRVPLPPTTTSPPTTQPPVTQPPAQAPQPTTTQAPAFDSGNPASVSTIAGTPPSDTAPTTTVAESAPVPIDPLLPDDESDGKPWIRLLIYLPVSVLVSAAVRFGHARL